MMTRLTKPVAMPAAVMTIISAVVVASLIAFGRLLAQSKLDTSRFIADSITSHFERREDRALLSRIDTTLQLICARTDCRSQPHP